MGSPTSLERTVLLAAAVLTAAAVAPQAAERRGVPSTGRRRAAASTDLMGYGWPDRGDPVLSACDIDALRFVFAWVFEGTSPHPPAAGPYDCSSARRGR